VGFSTFISFEAFNLLIFHFQLCIYCFSELSSYSGKTATKFLLAKVTPVMFYEGSHDVIYVVGDWEEQLCVVNGTSAAVKGMKEGKRYRCRVTAVNIYGKSEPLEGETFTAKNPFGEHYGWFSDTVICV